MTILLIVLIVVSWVSLLLVARELTRARRELAEVRRVTAPEPSSSLIDAITDERRESDDRVAHAEAVQHWLLAALDESTGEVKLSGV